MGEQNDDVHISTSGSQSENDETKVKTSPSGAQQAEENGGEQAAESVFQLTVNLPHEPHTIQIMVSTQEQVQDIRQSIVEFLGTFQYTCFHFSHKGKRVNDFVELSDVEDFTPDSELTLVEDPYTEKDARLHFLRIREILGASGDRVDAVQGILAGLSLYETISEEEGKRSSTSVSDPNGPSDTQSRVEHAMTDYEFEAPGSLNTLLPPVPTPSPKVIKSMCLSPWNPPPHSLRQRGHHLYLQVTTNEGEQFQITSTISGFFVNKNSNSKFDPFPRPPPKNFSSHSLLTLISSLSPSFEASFLALQEFNNRKDPLSTYQFSNAIPSNPWVVPHMTSPLCIHQADLTRTQESLLVSGLENAESLRDWNEEFQSTRELPRETVQERVFRERLTSKLFADYTDAAVRGAVLVARGEVPPLNPTEARDAQIFVYNNVFFSFGADGVGTFAADGGDEAARVATGKDVTGVRAVNQLDIEGLFTPGTVVVDYLGKRIVGQSIVPGIFKPRAPGEHQIDYGGVEGRDIIAENEAFVPAFEKLSKAVKVKKHAVWDKEGKRHDLEGSVETKGLLGTDGRKYVLDLYRITPLDVTWLEENWVEKADDDPMEISDKVERPGESYPHRMAVLRPELIDTLWKLKMREYVNEALAKRRQTNEKDDKIGEKVPGLASNVNGSTNGQAVDHEVSEENSKDNPVIEPEPEQDRIDVSKFDFAFNPDVFSGQTPPTSEEKEKLLRDESEVRTACNFLRTEVMSKLVQDLKDGDVGHPMDGQSLSRLLHQRGINIRYLGKVADMAKEYEPRLESLRALAKQEMLSRAFKHVANRYLRYLPMPFATSCVAHLLNCLLGVRPNDDPVPEVNHGLRSFYPECDFGFEKVTPEMLRKDIERQVRLRYRFELETDWLSQTKHAQLLREIALKLGLQLEAKDYSFTRCSDIKGQSSSQLTNGTSKLLNTAASSSTSNKKKKKAADHSPPSSVMSNDHSSPLVFSAENILNIAPIVKEAAPRSMLAEEALEAGRISLEQNQKDLGQELLLESLSLHEQIYGVLHAEVARFYSQLCMLYYRLEEKSAAVELARKAVIVSERTLGIDSTETILSFLNLGLLEHATGNTNHALAYIRHALELWKIVYGADHPDSITTINNAAVMLQHLKQYHESRLWFEASLKISEKIFGKQSPNTATLLFQLAQALALDHDSKGAVNRMREAYNIFLASLGADDKNTKEAESWLDQLTQNAVSIAKHAKDIQARRLRRLNFTPHVTLGTRPQPQVGQSSTDSTNGADPRNSIDLDSRSIDELMRFIEGGGDTSKRSSPKKRHGRSNPKRRGGAPVGAVA
ncbi:MAG: Intracellular distribution of mitochondria [Sclerophora amabilis]|nr:MAG: Intracellular distribution of mitochondria [Sclerophora amabilis]